MFDKYNFDELKPGDEVYEPVSVSCGWTRYHNHCYYVKRIVKKITPKKTKIVFTDSTERLKSHSPDLYKFSPELAAESAIAIKAQTSMHIIDDLNTNLICKITDEELDDVYEALTTIAAINNRYSQKE